MIISIKLTVYFEDPFWIGIFEAVTDKGYKASKVTFGAEPRDDEVYSFILRNFYKLKFTDDDKAYKKMIRKKENPKRLQREIKKVIKEHGAGTKAQEALKKQYEENKVINKKLSRLEKEKKEKELYEIRQKKKREKHKGH